MGRRGAAKVAAGAVILSAFLSGCATMPPTISLNYAPADGVYKFSTVRILSNHEVYVFPTVYGEVILGANGKRNLAFCEALFSGLLDSKSPIGIRMPIGASLPFIENRETVVIDVRPAQQLSTASESPGQLGASCSSRLTYVDYARSQLLISMLGLTGRGPWLLGRERDTNRQVHFDLSDYDDADFSEGVEKWKKLLAKKPKDWAVNERADLGYRVQHFMNEAGKVLPDLFSPKN
jgi:hypothetical protein